MYSIYGLKICYSFAVGSHSVDQIEAVGAFISTSIEAAARAANAF